MSPSNHLDNFLSHEERAILTVVYSLLGLFGLLGNGLALYAITSLGFRISLDIPANAFILSQVIADLGTALSCPLYITHVYSWNWDAFYVYTGFVWLASLGSLFLLTFNRLLSVVDSLKYPRRMSPCQAKLLVVAVWTIALLISLYHLLDIATDYIDYPNIGRYYIVSLTFSVVLFNWYMFRRSRIQARKIMRQTRAIVTGLQRNFKDDMKSVKTLALVGGSFLVSCIPFTLVVFVSGDKRSISFQRRAAFWGPLMAVNCVLDPLIYFFRGPEFRSFYRRLKRLRERKKACKTKFRRSGLKVVNRRLNTKIHCSGVTPTAKRQLTEFM